jgi:hypothetical protein
MADEQITKEEVLKAGERHFRISQGDGNVSFRDHPGSQHQYATLGALLLQAAAVMDLADAIRGLGARLGS